MNMSRKILEGGEGEDMRTHRERGREREKGGKMHTFLIDDWTTSSVDKDGVWFHQLQLFFVDKVMSRCVQVSVDTRSWKTTMLGFDREKVEEEQEHEENALT
jgi:hypothetical protein